MRYVKPNEFTAHQQRTRVQRKRRKPTFDERCRTTTRKPGFASIEAQIIIHDAIKMVAWVAWWCIAIIGIDALL